MARKEEQQKSEQEPTLIVDVAADALDFSDTTELVSQEQDDEVFEASVEKNLDVTRLYLNEIGFHRCCQLKKKSIFLEWYSAAKKLAGNGWLRVIYV